MRRRYIFLDIADIDYSVFKSKFKDLYIWIYGLEGYAGGDVKIFRKDGNVVISVTPKGVYRTVAVSTLLSNYLGKKVLFKGVYTTVRRGLRKLKEV